MLRPFRFSIPLLLALAFAGIACGEDEPKTYDPAIPNIVMVIGDDHGWPYFGFMGDPIVKTPRLDSLAREGVVFPYGYTTASTCRPSLRTLLTGLHPIQWRVKREAMRASGREPASVDRIRDFTTLPRLLQQRDFASFQGGKYWEGSFEGGGFTHGMKSLAMTETARGPHAKMQERAGGESLALGRTTMEPLFDFLAAHTNQPFFVWFAPKLPHTPHDPPDELLALYEGYGLTESARRYYANITRFDLVLGQLLDRIERLGLREKTLIIYLSDNGWEQGPHETIASKQLGGPKGKSSMYELGFRTPVVVSWPGRIEGGRRMDRLVSEVDVFTTLLEFAKLDPPSDRTGKSFAPALLGEPGPSRETVIGSMGSLRPPATATHVRTKPGRAIVRPERAFFLRNAQWHYIWYAWHKRFPDRPAQALFRVDVDPYESNDVADDHPELIAGFREEIERWRVEVATATRQREQ